MHAHAGPRELAGPLASLRRPVCAATPQRLVHAPRMIRGGDKHVAGLWAPAVRRRGACGPCASGPSACRSPNVPHVQDMRGRRRPVPGRTRHKTGRHFGALGGRQALACSGASVAALPQTRDAPGSCRRPLFGYAQPPSPPAGRRLDLERKSGGRSACPPSRSGADTGQRMMSSSTTGNWPRIEHSRATAAIPATTSLACMNWPPPCNHWASCPPCNARPRHPNAQCF